MMEKTLREKLEKTTQKVMQENARDIAREIEDVNIGPLMVEINGVI